MSLKTLFFFLLLLSVSSFARAGFFAQGGLHFGGDTLVTAILVDGTTEKITGGGLLSGTLGYESDISESLLLKLSAGLKFDTIIASNSDLFFSRYPIEAILFAKGEQFHLGVGLTHHNGVKLTGDPAFAIPSVNFQNATGYVVQLDYLLSERGYLSLKYTAIDYQVTSAAPKLDGSSIGLIIGFRFGN